MWVSTPESARLVESRPNTRPRSSHDFQRGFWPTFCASFLLLGGCSQSRICQRVEFDVGSAEQLALQARYRHHQRCGKPRRSPQSYRCHCWSQSNHGGCRGRQSLVARRDQQASACAGAKLTGQQPHAGFKSGATRSAQKLLEAHQLDAAGGECGELSGRMGGKLSLTTPTDSTVLQFAT